MNEVYELVGIMERELDLNGMQQVSKHIKNILVQPKHNDGKRFRGR
jgi:hypothetical protein